MSLQNAVRGAADVFGRDGLHATEVHGTLPQEAGGTGDMLPEHGVARAGRACPCRIGGAKNSQDRRAQQRGEVHGSGIIGQQQLTATQFLHEGLQGGFSDQVTAFSFQQVS